MPPQLLVLVALGALIYFTTVRPNRRNKQQRAKLMSQLSAGDEIITIGGIHGRVDEVGDGTVDVEIADGVIVRFERRAVASITRDVVDEAPELDEAPDDEDEDEPADAAEEPSSSLGETDAPAR